VVRKQLEDELINVRPGRPFDETALRTAVRRVMDPKRTGKPRGPEGFQLDVNAPVTWIRARLEAIQKLDEIDDELFEWARTVYRVQRLGYASVQPQLAADPDVGHLAEPSSLNEVVNQACSNLLTTLGLVLLSLEGRESGLGEFFDPARSPLAAAIGPTMKGEPETST